MEILPSPPPSSSSLGLPPLVDGWRGRNKGRGLDSDASRLALLEVEMELMDRGRRSGEEHVGELEEFDDALEREESNPSLSGSEALEDGIEVSLIPRNTDASQSCSWCSRLLNWLRIGRQGEAVKEEEEWEEMEEVESEEEEVYSPTLDLSVHSPSSLEDEHYRVPRFKPSRRRRNGTTRRGNRPSLKGLGKYLCVTGTLVGYLYFLTHCPGDSHHHKWEDWKTRSQCETQIVINLEADHCLLHPHFDQGHLRGGGGARRVEERHLVRSSEDCREAMKSLEEAYICRGLVDENWVQSHFKFEKLDEEKG